MVGVLYGLILAPIAIWLATFGRETWLALGQSETAGQSADKPANIVYTHASWEITHTMLVYAFTVFVISHADSLEILDRELFLPICVFMISLMLRGCLFLYVSYAETVKRPVLYYSLLSLSYLVSLVSVLVGFVLTVTNILLYNIQPSTDNLPIVAVGFVLTAGLCAIPIWTAYHPSE